MPILCSICNKEFANKYYPEHLRTHTGDKPFVCNDCPAAFVSKGNLKKHVEIKHKNKRYTCKNCTRVFSTPNLLSKHNENAKQENGIKCKSCCSYFTRSRDLSTHLRKVHGILETCTDDNTVDELAEKDSESLTSENDASNVETMSHHQTSQNSGPHGNDDDVDVIPPTQEEVQQETPTSNPRQIKLSNISAASFALKRGSNDATFLKPGNPVSASKKLKLAKPQEANQEAIQLQHEPPPFEQSQFELSQYPQTQFEHSQQFPDIDDRDQANDADTNESDHVPIKSPVVIQAEELGEIAENASEDFDLRFVLETWGLSTSQEKLHTLMQDSGNDVNKIATVLIHFLRQGKLEVDASKFIEIMRQKPESTVGYFIASLMLLSFASKQSVKNLVSIYEMCLDLPTEFRNLGEKLAVLAIQTCLAKGDVQQVFCLDIPDAIGGQLKFGTDTLYQQNDQGVFDLLVPVEECKINVIMHLTDLMHQDLQQLDYCLADHNADLFETAKKYSNLLHNYMKSIYKHSAPNLFNLLLMYQLKNCIGTEIYLTFQDHLKIAPLQLHKLVVCRFGNASPYLQEPVSAKEEDIKVFIDLLYLDFDPKYYTGKISLGVFQLAEKLQVGEISRLLFRGHSYQQLANNKNKVDIMQILIKLENWDQVDVIASTFMDWLLDKERSQCMNGLSLDQVLKFCSRDALKAPELEIYKILLQWSFYQCGRDCKDELGAEFQTDVYEKFKTVRKVLRICNLSKYFDQLQKQKYINLRDVMNALSFKAKKILSSQQMDLEYSVDVRDRTK